ncbi:MAG: FimB/Mfa2 family fimbrial subunit [Muribaculaceae bacterium]|nr:FimB/Mfa2 family fimbrial subunit [Muribaculaceae bacterium]MDE6026966.1 FimB/Mfa2 family fimbrial subunit [Muribaculaceae bacterium]
MSALFSLIALGSCSDNLFDEEEYGNASAIFSISAGGDEVGVVTRAGEVEEPKTIKDMRFLISDLDGNIIDHHYGKFENQFTKLTIDGLKQGSYEILFLASLSEGNGASFSSPVSTSDTWLETETEGKPVDGLYCYKKVPFSVGPNNAVTEVSLEHCLARVFVDLEMPNQSLWRNVKKVSVSFKEEIPSALNADGTYSGAEKMESYEIYDPSGTFTFTTFPAEKPVSGYVDIESSREGDENFVQRYEFSDLKLEAGKVARINLAYRHPELQSGLLHVTHDELWRFNPDTMFLASEPREVFYDNSLRYFYAERPLMLSVTPEGDLGLKFYSPIPIKNVKIKALFNKITTEWVDLALIEDVDPFMDCTFELPVKKQDCIYETESGRKIKVPAMADLSPLDYTVKFECDDPFMKKIATIDSHWHIRFSPYQADQGHAYWRHMDPLLCRHAVALALNMAYMFSSPEFNDMLQEYDGILHDDSNNPIDLDALRRNIRNHGGLKMGRVVGVGGLGGGQTYGLADYCYTGVYHNSTPEGVNPHNYPRQAMFHEYGHCLGYGHSSNMTYGDCWTVICATVFVELGRAGKLPVSNITDVTNLPM